MKLPPMTLQPSLPVAPPAPGGDQEQTAREFEAMFLTQNFELAFKTLPDSAFGGGHAGETWRHFLAKAVAEEVAQSGRTGIRDQIAPLLLDPET